MSDGQSPAISIVIKALNEERRIAATIESALAAAKGKSCEIILADCASTDFTVEIASQYPIKIVRMTHIEDRSCGAGGQLGYQHSKGCYVWLIDGDMRVRPAFLNAAIQFLEDHPEFAGVGGMLTEHETSNLEYIKRQGREYAARKAGIVTRLDGGGVYRRAAIEEAGYLTDRNIHGSEELELGARLAAKGWRLGRLPIRDVDHYGHAGNAYSLLLRRFRSKVAWATGEVLRAAIGTPHLSVILRHKKRELALQVLVHAWWLCLVAAAVLPAGLTAKLLALAALLAVPVLAMSLRSRSLAIGVYSVVAWQVYTAGFWPGLLRRRVAPTRWIESTVVQEGAQPAAPVAPHFRRELKDRARSDNTLAVANVA